MKAGVQIAPDVFVKGCGPMQGQTVRRLDGDAQAYMDVFAACLRLHQPAALARRARNREATFVVG